MTPERLAEIRAKLAKHPDPRPGYPVHDAQRLLAYVDQLEAQLSGERSTAMDIQHANEEHIAQLEAQMVEAYLRGHSNGLEQSAQVFELEAEQGLEDMTFAEFCEWTAGRIRDLQSTPGTKAGLDLSVTLSKDADGGTTVGFDKAVLLSAPLASLFRSLTASEQAEYAAARRELFTPALDPAVDLVRRLAEAVASRKTAFDMGFEVCGWCRHTDSEGHRENCPALTLNRARAWLEGRE